MRASLGLLTLFVSSFVFAEVVVPIDSVENHVNVRMFPDARSEIVGRLRQGESIPLIKTSDNWHEVELAGDATGYVSADWSLVVSEDSLVVGGSIEGARGQAVAAGTIAVDSVTPADKQPSSEADSGPGIRSAVEPQSDEENGQAEARVTAHRNDPETGDDEPSELVVESITTETESDAEQSDHLEELRIDFSSLKRVNIENKDTLVENRPADASVVDEAAIDDDTKKSPGDSVVANGNAEGPIGPRGPKGERGPPGLPGAATVEGSVDFLVKFSAPTLGANSQVYDDGINVGINTTEPKQRLDVNGNIQIHDRNSNVAGLMISQADGDTGYIMHNRANTLTIGAGSIDRITIDRDGNIGFSIDRPQHPIEMASGAYVSAGGVWTNSSSRSRKENIDRLSPEDALRTLVQLQPVEFNYKNDQKEKYVGFIAEDVPDLVASADRKSVSPMDIVAVLTKVVQEQQIKIAELEARLDQR